MHDDSERTDADRAAGSSALGHQVVSSFLADQVSELLRGWIARGEWQPGKQLRIREVAGLVGTSELPVREAFGRLAQAGLIVIEPYKGATVRVLRIDELEHTYDVRIMLEPEAGRQGALRAGAEVVQTMRRHWQLLGAASEQGDVAGAVAEDENILNALYEAGTNDVLARVIRGLWDTCRPYKSLWVINAVEQGLATWSHLPSLIDAVEGKDGHAASTILEDTYRDARAVVRQLLDGRQGEV